MENNGSDRDPKWFEKAQALLDLLNNENYTTGGWSVGEPSVLGQIDRFLKARC
jgi:hypothetical protein